MGIRVAAATLAVSLLCSAAWAGDPLPLRLTLDGAASAPAARPDLDAKSDRQDLHLTLFWENDGGWVKPYDRHDNHYTAGIGALLAWHAPWVDDLLGKVPSPTGEFPRQETDYAMGFIAGLTIYTPTNLADPNPIPDDHPYAGWTWGGLFFQRANRNEPIGRFESLELDLGIVGPSSLAENAQDRIHESFRYVIPQGWNNQIHDEPEFSLQYNRRWRLPDLVLIRHDSGNLRLQILPDAGITAGSLLDELHGGLLFRIGKHLPDDFGPGTLTNPGDYTWLANRISSSMFNHPQSQSFYLFARPYGRLVAHNVLLQGDNWRFDDPMTVTPNPAVFGAQLGAALRFFQNFEIDYIYTIQSPEFHARRGWAAWASFQLSFAFSF